MIADQFRRVRKEKKLSQRDVAERMSVSHQAYQQYEAGTRQPKMSTIVRIAEAMDVDPIVFLDDDMLESMELSPESESEVIAELLQDILNEESTQIRANRLREYSVQLDIMKAAHESYTDSADRLMTYYNKLNYDGKKEAIKRVEELTQLDRYKDE